jgi:hypothetical protein
MIDANRMQPVGNESMHAIPGTKVVLERRSRCRDRRRSQTRA